MKRLIKIQDELQENKYILQEEYEGFGIYLRKTPSGFYSNQDWLITDDNTTIICPSFNNYCKEELQDAIDNYNESGSFGLKAMKNNGLYVIHPSGKVAI